MRQRLALAFAIVLVLVLMVPVTSGAAPASHTEYTFESANFPLANPFDPTAGYIRPVGHMFRIYNLPIGGNYVADDVGPAWVQETVSGWIAPDFSAGVFHGPATLMIENEGDPIMCAGHHSAVRKDFVEHGKFYFRCDDGTTRRSTWSFDVLVNPDGSLVAPWFVSGSGVSLNPKG